MKNTGSNSSPFLTGCGTALITPFSKDGAIDEEALRNLISSQIISGVDFLVPCGTTGESPTLSHDDHIRVVKIVTNEAGGRVPIIPGTGSNSTREARYLTECAMAHGANGVLVVSPYYNKPNQNGLIAHFTAVADVGLPVIVYNIPGRTGIDVSPQALAELSLHPNIVGVKEATGSLERMSLDISLCGSNFSYLSGDDSLTLPLMSIGGHGVISVISNLLPLETSLMVRAALHGDFENARVIHGKLFSICRAMFTETNPIPIKMALAMAGVVEPMFRSPMGYPKESTIELIREEMIRFGFAHNELREVMPISVIA